MFPGGNEEAILLFTIQQAARKTDTQRPLIMSLIWTAASTATFCWRRKFQRTCFRFSDGVISAYCTYSLSLSFSVCLHHNIQPGDSELVLICRSSKHAQRAASPLPRRLLRVHRWWEGFSHTRQIPADPSSACCWSPRVFPHRDSRGRAGWDSGRSLCTRQPAHSPSRHNPASMWPRASTPW